MNCDCSGNQKIVEQIFNVNIALSKKSNEDTGDVTPANGDRKAENAHKRKSVNCDCSGTRKLESKSFV